MRKTWKPISWTSWIASSRAATKRRQCGGHIFRKRMVRAGRSASQARTCGKIPIAPAAPPPHTSRDFVPWRFLDAGRKTAWIVSASRRPKTCTEVAIQSLASEQLKSTRSRGSTTECAIRTPDLADIREPAPVNTFQGTGARDPFRACSAQYHFSPISRLLDSGLRHTYAGRDWTRGQQRGCSPPPKPADTGWSGLGVWRATRSRGP
jgi:hypothetical protein